MKKKLKRGSHYLKDLFISCLDKLAVEKKVTKGEVEEEEEESLLSFTTRWIRAVDRGGLFIVNDEVYSFFLAMEMRFLLPLSSQRKSIENWPWKLFQMKTCSFTGVLFPMKWMMRVQVWNC